jgi:hypothetical protein
LLSYVVSTCPGQAEIAPYSVLYRITWNKKGCERNQILSHPEFFAMTNRSAAVTDNDNIATLLDHNLDLVTTAPLVNNDSLATNATATFDTRVPFTTRGQADGNVVAGFAATGVIDFECGLGGRIAATADLATTTTLTIDNARLVAALRGGSLFVRCVCRDCEYTYLGRIGEIGLAVSRPDGRNHNQSQNKQHHRQQDPFRVHNRYALLKLVTEAPPCASKMLGDLRQGSPMVTSTLYSIKNPLLTPPAISTTNSQFDI